MRIERCTQQMLEDWLLLRRALWPDTPEADHRHETRDMLDRPERLAALLALTPENRAAGFAEVSLREDYVNGCETSPVAFLEGIYVDPPFRGRGVARLLCQAAEAWATERGCREFASDVEFHNTDSQRMHEALGFKETERVVYYRKLL